MNDIALEDKPVEVDAQARVKTPRRSPIPLADRRRINISYEPAEPKKPIIRDWASI